MFAFLKRLFSSNRRPARTRANLQRTDDYDPDNRDRSQESLLQQNKRDHEESVARSWDFYYEIARRFLTGASKTDQQELLKQGQLLLKSGFKYIHIVVKPVRPIGKKAVKSKRPDQVPSHERDKAKRAAG